VSETSQHTTSFRPRLFEIIEINSIKYCIAGFHDNGRAWLVRDWSVPYDPQVFVDPLYKPRAKLWLANLRRNKAKIQKRDLPRVKSNVVILGPGCSLEDYRGQLWRLSLRATMIGLSSVIADPEFRSICDFYVAIEASYPEAWLAPMKAGLICMPFVEPKLIACFESIYWVQPTAARKDLDLDLPALDISFSVSLPAMQFAFQQGAKRIILFGHDFCAYGVWRHFGRLARANFSRPLHVWDVEGRLVTTCAAYLLAHNHVVAAAKLLTSLHDVDIICAGNKGLWQTACRRLPLERIEELLNAN